MNNGPYSPIDAIRNELAEVRSLVLTMAQQNAAMAQVIAAQQQQLLAVTTALVTQFGADFLPGEKPLEAEKPKADAGKGKH